MHQILYLPSELTNRDWDARLLMADYAANAGHTVIIGQQWQVLRSIEHLPHGLLMIKTMNQIQGKAVETVRQLGHMVVTMDEEALPLDVDQETVGAFLAKGYSAPAVENCHLFFANSPLHQQCVEKAVPGLRGKVITTGNARADLLTAARRGRYTVAADELRRQHGPYILFNSNTASRNSIWDKEKFIEIQIAAGALDPENKESIALFREQLGFEEANARIFEALLKWCVDNAPRHTIIIRPHPSEGEDYWTKFAAENPRVKVLWGTPHIPYMMAADLVVHTNCTTGIEAALLDRPTLNLMPMPESYWTKLYIANKVSPTFGNIADAQAAVRTLLDTGAGPLLPNETHRAELLRYYPCISDSISAATSVAAMTRMLQVVGAKPAPAPEYIKSRLVPHVLEGTARRKFSKSLTEAVSDYKATRRISGVTRNVAFAELSDSLFIVYPAA